ncbi:hypothetical protein FZEAL_2499 [Fusarium zealandicum]|uniref:Uncharacterized protein n=1 Tax=Fusarium zealandicum TaxID=1053134 RepID=A0A8H4UQR6_9HYPO|nr:hypothetical protein FZEAL_2499 [Fusarium zealandicum]
MWEVKDEYCVNVAQTIYESLRDGGVTDEAVCRGLHKATKKLRDRWLDTLDEGGTEVLGLARALEETSLLAIEGLGGVREPRDVVLCDEDATKMVDWVPYIHVGV